MLEPRYMPHLSKHTAEILCSGCLLPVANALPNQTYSANAVYSEIIDQVNLIFCALVINRLDEL